MIGILLILASTTAYNGSAVLLAAEVRRATGGSALLLAVSRRAPGAFAVFLNVVGWSLEVAALTLIPLTLARILNAAGLALLLGLARWVLQEPVGHREALAVVLVALGLAAVSLAPPLPSGPPPSLWEWALLFAILGPGIALPYVLRALRWSVGPVLGATAAGLAYALSGILNKGFAEAVHAARIPVLLPLATCIVTLGISGFVVELDALKRGRASVVVPIVLVIHTVVPIACAPFFFDEAWPAGPLRRALLGGGILLTLMGSILLSGSRTLAVEGG